MTTVILEMKPSHTFHIFQDLLHKPFYLLDLQCVLETDEIETRRNFDQFPSIKIETEQTDLSRDRLFQRPYITRRIIHLHPDRRQDATAHGHNSTIPNWIVIRMEIMTLWQWVVMSEKGSFGHSRINRFTRLVRIPEKVLPGASVKNTAVILDYPLPPMLCRFPALFQGITRPEALSNAP